MTCSIAQDEFNSLLSNYFSAWFRYHPELAVHVGVDGYEDYLTPFSDEEFGALISLNQKIINSLEEINFDALSAAQQLDFRIMYHAANIELHELSERDWRFISPQRYLPLEAIHQLIYRPVENMHQSLKHRLQAIPEYLRSAKSYLKQTPEAIPLSWIEDAIMATHAGALFMRDLLRNPVVVNKFQNPSRLQPICDDATHALEDYEKFLRKELLPYAQGSYACGEPHFNALLSDWHCLGINADQLYQFGQKLFEQTQQELIQLCDEMSVADVNTLLAGIREQHPENTADDLMNAYRSRMKAAYSFVVDNALVTMPETQALKVIETPVYMRHEIPFAAYEEPSYQDPEQRGYYYVTPVKSDGHLLEHNWISIDLTCVHEAFPGHHLQFVKANKNPENSLPRMLNASATMYEGWALYCEDLMQEQGFLSKPEHKAIMLRDRLWRALRVMLDVELHTRNLQIDEAAQRMCDILGFSIDQAKADLSWYTQSPTVPMGYAVGWALIKALRTEESKKTDFDLKKFHDQLLSVGSCALPLVIIQAFGEDAWQKAKKSVFPE